MRIGIALPSYGPAARDPSMLQDALQAAEDLGYDGVWFADHLAVPSYASPPLRPPFLEALTMCTWALGRTSRLRVGTDVLVAPYRHPLALAATAGSIATLHPGRLVLGVGIGYLSGELTALDAGPHSSRGARTSEVLRRVRQVWEQGEGELHVMTPTVPVPLWVGGNAPAALHRAALLGDGWHPLWPDPSTYRKAREEIVATRAANGIEGQFTFSYSSPVSLLADGSAGAGTMSPPEPAHQDLSYQPTRPRTPDGRTLLAGTPDQVRNDLSCLADAGVEHLVAHLGARALVKALEQLAELL